MNIKKPISIFLLAFVVVSIAFLVYKEFAQRDLKTEVQISDTGLSHQEISLLNEDALVKDSILTQQEINPILLKPKPAVANKDSAAKKIVSKSGRAEPSQSTSKEGTIPSFQQPPAIKSKVIAYYFHGTHRCFTCLIIEKYSRQAIGEYFAKELQNGRLEFKPLNVEEPENRHYIRDYRLYTKSLVIALFKDDEQKEYKNLEGVWFFVRDKEKFYQYVKNEVERFLQKAG